MSGSDLRNQFSLASKEVILFYDKLSWYNLENENIYLEPLWVSDESIVVFNMYKERSKTISNNGNAFLVRAY